MCGRFYIDEEQNEDLLKIVRNLSTRFSGHAKLKHGDVNPSDLAAVLTVSDKKIVPDAMRFGFLSSNHARPIINARSESALQKPLFSSSVFNSRILIPTNGFFEWDQHHNHAKYYFTKKNGSLMYFAGLYRILENTECFVILTTSANDSMKDIHSRMPLILPDDSLDDWLFDTNKAIDLLSYTPELLKKECQSPPSSYSQLTLPFV